MHIQNQLTGLRARYAILPCDACVYPVISGYVLDGKAGHNWAKLAVLILAEYHEPLLVK